MSIRSGHRHISVDTYKYTEGEIRRYLAEEDGAAALMALKYILERGDRIIKRGDMSDPERDSKLTE